MYHLEAEEAAIRNTLPFRYVRPADSRKTRVKEKRSQPDKKMFGTIPAQATEENWHASFHEVRKVKSPTSTALWILLKARPLLREKPNEMSEYTFEMVPQLVGRIAELLSSIDQKLDRVNVSPMQSDNTPELMNIKQLGEYLPSHPSTSTIYGWCHENQIPYYKQGKRTFFKKSAVDKWLLRTRVKDQTELMEEAAEYCRTHPIGGRRR